MKPEHEDGYVLVWEHGGQTAQLPAPPPLQKKSRVGRKYGFAALSYTYSKKPFTA